MKLFGNGSGSPPAAVDDGRPAPAAAAPGFTWVSGAAAALPPLGVQKAWPLASDRWERLTAAITLPVPAERVWHALTTPETLRDWLGVCRGALTDTSSECVLDFEDGEFFLCRPTRVEPGRHLEFLCAGSGSARPAA